MFNLQQIEQIVPSEKVCGQLKKLHEMIPATFAWYKGEVILMVNRAWCTSPDIFPAPTSEQLGTYLTTEKSKIALPWFNYEKGLWEFAYDGNHVQSVTEVDARARLILAINFNSFYYADNYKTGL